MESLKSSANYKIAVTLDGAWILYKQQPTTLVVQDSVTGEQLHNLKLRPKKLRRKIAEVKVTAKSINGQWLIFIFEDNTFSEWYLSQKFNQDKSDPSFIYRAASQNSCWALRETKSK